MMKSVYISSVAKKFYNLFKLTFVSNKALIETGKANKGTCNIWNKLTSANVFYGVRSFPKAINIIKVEFKISDGLSHTERTFNDYAISLDFNV